MNDSINERWRLDYNNEARRTRAKRMTLDICMICMKQLPHDLIPNICPDCYREQQELRKEAQRADRTVTA